MFDEIIIDVPDDVRFADPATAAKIAPMQIIIEQKTNAVNSYPAARGGQHIRPVIRLRT